jgi:hypothetical protein
VAVVALAGCSVERFNAVVPIDNGNQDATNGSAGSALDGGADAPGEGNFAAWNQVDGSDGAASTACTNPAFITSSPGGIWNSGGYFVFNNVWNTDAGPGPQTLYACSYESFYVVSDQPDNGGAVKGYPNVQMNFNEIPVRSLHSITSTFAERSPHVGIYENAYDIWLNGIATASSSQLMVWVDNFNRVPAGTQVTTTTLGGRTYDVWKTPDNSFIALVSTAAFTSGTVDLLELLDWAIAQGWLSTTTTLGQIDFGVEIVSTGGASATYFFDAFSISVN